MQLPTMIVVPPLEQRPRETGYPGMTVFAETSSRLIFDQIPFPTVKFERLVDAIFVEAFFRKFRATLEPAAGCCLTRLV
jgi:hypothetical protein